jgi:hypothetical protein
MRSRLSCLLVAVALLGFGTLAFADPNVSVNCTGSPTQVCTITEVLYYPGSNAGSPGTATGTQNYSPASAGNPTGTNLVTATWQAIYTFDDYGFFNTGYSLQSSTFTAMDTSTATETLQQTSNVDNYYGYAVSVNDAFTLNSSFSGHFLLDTNNTIGSAPDTTSNYENCNADQNAFNGGTDTSGCVYLTSGGTPITESGFYNSSASIATPTALKTGNTTTNIYEQVTGVADINGPSPNSDAPNGSTAASEVVVTFTYDVPPPSTGTPEPATLLMLGTGLSFVASRLRRNKNEAK